MSRRRSEEPQPQSQPDFDMEESDIEPNHPIFRPIVREDSYSAYPMSGRPGSYRPGSPYRDPRGSRGYYSPRRYGVNDDVDSDWNSTKIVWQIIGAGLLVVAALVTSRSSLPMAQNLKSWAQSAIHQDMNVAAIPAWYKTHFGQGSLAANGNPVVSTTAPAIEPFQFPVQDGKVINDYQAQIYPAVLLRAPANSPVKAVMTGTVTTVDKNDLYGQFIIVDHGTMGKTLYGKLGSVKIEKGAVVKTGETVGTVAKDSQGLYFAYIKGDQFVNPHQLLDTIKR